VTEDEAFIRTIVDRPGDDLPRLVYADWLDERNDPRGAYLRAELTVVIDGKGKTTLPKLADGLDPVWVARVSRPPVGVCLDTNDLVDRGPRVSVDEITNTEKRLGFDFPADYRAFLLNYNGGVIEVGGYETPHGVVDSGFYTFDSSARNSPTERRDALARIDNPLEAEWFSRFYLIGHNPDMIFGTLLGIRGVERGTITHFDFSSDWSPVLLETPYQAQHPSFTQYLSSILQ
jgi:uncharacterized protein (TIGR02996 family)